jgi:hypothetical protein
MHGVLGTMSIYKYFPRHPRYLSNLVQNNIHPARVPSSRLIEHPRASPPVSTRPLAPLTKRRKRLCMRGKRYLFGTSTRFRPGWNSPHASQPIAPQFLSFFNRPTVSYLSANLNIWLNKSASQCKLKKKEEFTKKTMQLFFLPAPQSIFRKTIGNLPANN